MIISVLNNSGSSISRGSVVRQAGTQRPTQLPTIALASASSASTAIVLGICNETIANGAVGRVVISGSFSTLDTSGFSLNGTAYLSNTAGNISSSPGTVSSIVGIIRIVSPSVGSIFVGSGQIADDAETPEGENVNVIGIGETTAGVVHHFAIVTSVASGGTGTITYTTSAGITFYLKQIIAAASAGPCKVIIDYGSGPTAVATEFFSDASPVADLTFNQPVPIGASTAVRIKIINNNPSAQDVYGTIIGREV